MILDAELQRRMEETFEACRTQPEYHVPEAETVTTRLDGSLRVVGDRVAFYYKWPTIPNWPPQLILRKLMRKVMKPVLWPVVEFHFAVRDAFHSVRDNLEHQSRMQREMRGQMAALENQIAALQEQVRQLVLSPTASFEANGTNSVAMSLAAAASDVTLSPISTNEKPEPITATEAREARIAPRKVGLRVAMDLQSLQSRNSRGRGIGRYVGALASALLEETEGIEFIFYASASMPFDSVPELLQERTTLLPLTENGLDPANEALVRTFLTAADVDVVFLPSPIEGSDVALPYLGDFPAVVYAICYDLIPLVFAERYLPDPSSRAGFERRLRNIRSADRILCISDCTRQDTVRILEVMPDRAVTIGTGVTGNFRVLPADEKAGWADRLRERFGIDRSYLLCTGGGDARKNMHSLIEAFGLMPMEIRDERQLVIVCHLTPGEEQELKERAQACGLFPSALVLTNFVTDEELNALYNRCELFVFPSIYEGFGLPLVEAMRCGAPVTAGDNSSMIEIVPAPDQRFDAASPFAISRRLVALLSDRAALERIGREGPVQAERFTWTKVAERTREQLHRAPERPGYDFSPLPLTAPARPRIAFFSPFLPQRSGISDYSEELLPSLKAFYTCDLFIDEGYTPLPRLAQAYSVHPHRFWSDSLGHRKGDYRAALFQMGNSNFHVYEYIHLLRSTGITVLHDYAIGGMINWAEHHAPTAGVKLKSELTYAYGDERARAILRDMSENRYTIDDLPERGIYVNRRIFTRSLGVIVHNRWAFEKAQKEHGDIQPNIALIPVLMPPVPADATPITRHGLRKKYDIPDDAFVFAPAGIIALSKRVLPILDAFQNHLAEHPDAFLLFVGELKMPAGTSFESEIARRGLGERVRVTGYIEDISVFYEYLRLSDVALTLRYPSNGETSGALLRLLAIGKPTIVSDIGSFSEYPDDVVYKITTPDKGDEVAALYRAMRRLRDDVSFREALGTRALEYVRQNHSPEHCARLYHAFIERVMDDPATKARLAAETAGREAAYVLGQRNGPLAETSESDILAAFAATLQAGITATAAASAPRRVERVSAETIATPVR